MSTATATRPAVEHQARPRFSLSERELREYSLARAILTSAENQEGSERRAEKNCLELEISQTLERSITGKRHGGLFVPWNISAGSFARKTQQRAGLDSATATKGTELKFTEPGAFIDFLYNQMRVKELGAQTVTGLRDNVAFPKQTGKATGSWVAENPGSDVADSNLALGQVLSSPKTYQSSDVLFETIARPGCDRCRHAGPTGPRSRYGSRRQLRGDPRTERAETRRSGS